MLSLPQALFQHIMLFNDSKSIFSSKRVSKQWDARTSDPNIWKLKVKQLHPDMPLSFMHNYEAFIKNSFYEKPIFSLEDFDFLITISRNGETLSTHAFEADNYKPLYFTPQWLKDLHEEW